MSDRVIKAEWLKSVIGVDLPPPVGGREGGAPLRATGNKGGGSPKSVKDTVVSIFSSKKGKDEGKGTGGTDTKDLLSSDAAKQFDAAIKRLDGEIKKLTDAGLNATHYNAQAKQFRDSFEAAKKLGSVPEQVNAVAALVPAVKDAADKAAVDIEKVGKSAVEGIGSAIGKMRDGAETAINKLGDKDKKKAGLQKRLAALDKLIDETSKVTDRADRAKKLKKVNADAQSLFDEAAKAVKDDDLIQETYAKALEERYGIEIKNPSGMKNTHLEKVYKMFDKVPETDVVQGSLKTLQYDPVDDQGNKNTGAAFGGTTIYMGDYGDESWEYQNPKTKKTEKPNGFSISTLHELGHSVDDRFKIMDGNQSKAGAGGWKVESIASVTTVFVQDFKRNAGKKITIDDALLTDLVTKSLQGARVKRPDRMSDEDWNKQDKTAKPGGMSDKDWAVVGAYLDLCFSRRNDQWPWGKPHDIGGRAYHESYPNEWVSYLMATRAKSINVRDYQWRAPGEFFAELYAYSYYNSKPAPSGVEPALAAYMYGGKSSGKK